MGGVTPKQGIEYMGQITTHEYTHHHAATGHYTNSHTQQIAKIELNCM